MLHVSLKRGFPLHVQFKSCLLRTGIAVGYAACLIGAPYWGGEEAENLTLFSGTQE